MDPKKNVKLITMIVLNVINFGLVAFWSFDGAIMPLFLTTKFGLSNIYISLIIDIGKFMIFISLFMGIFSDLSQYTWGKRRPLMLIGGLISAPLIACIPHIPNIWMLVGVMTVIYFNIQFAAVPFFALVPEVVPNEKLGTANAFFSVFGGVGTLVSYIIILSIVYKINKPLAFYVVAASHLAGTLITVVCIKEFLPEMPKKVNKLAAMISSVKEMVVELPRLPELSWFMLSNLFFWLGLGAFLVYFTKFVEYYVNIPGTKAGIVLGVVVVVSILLAVPVGILGDKLNRKKFVFCGMFTVFLGLLAGYFLIGPTSKVSGYDLANKASVLKLAAVYNYDMAGADLSAFKNEKFSPLFDANNDGLSDDKKCDVMRWCLNGDIDAKRCEMGVSKVLGAGSATVKPTVAAFESMKASITKETNKVLMIAFGVIAFAAIGLTICFVIMAAILPTLMPEDKMGLYMGFYSSVTGLGQFLSVLIAGLVIDLTLAAKISALGYRWVFFQGTIMLLLAALTLLRVPYIPNAKDPTITQKMNAKK
ncbi:MAG: MFS transporter [bacterium]